MHFPFKLLQHLLCCRSLHGLNLMLCVCVLGLFIFTFHTSQQRSLLALEATGAGARQQQKRQVLEGGVVTRGRGLTSVVQEGEGARGTKESWEAISNNPHLEQRMKFQQAQMKSFCDRFPDLYLSPTKDWLRKDMFKHLLYNDEKKIIFCYVPKVGCSNWKRMFLVLEGRLPVPSPSAKRPSEAFLNSVSKLANLSPEERDWRLKEYFKFAIIREPLERLVSGYVNKIGHPLSRNLSAFPEFVKADIVRKVSPSRLQQFKRSHGQMRLIPTFGEYLQYMSTADKDMMNEHFKPFINLCHPCYLEYNFIGNFKNLPEDAYAVLDHLGIPREYYPTEVSHPALSTSQLLPLFFSDMTAQQKVLYARELASSHHARVPKVPREVLSEATYDGVISSMLSELDLYYSLYPEDKDKHHQYRTRSGH